MCLASKCVHVLFLYNNLFPACSITLICNSTCLFCLLKFCCFGHLITLIYINHLITLIYINHLITLIYINPFHNLSKSIEFVNLIKHFKYLFISSLFSFGQLSCFVMFLFRTSLSLCSFGHSYIRWSTVWLPVPQGHSDDSIILNLWRQSFVFPWAVTIAVKLGVR